MTLDTTPLERNCVVFQCDRRAVDPDRGRVHCAGHEPASVTASLAAVPPAPEPEPAAAPVAPDMAALEPHWDGTQWVLRPKETPAGLACPHCGMHLEVTIR